MTTRFLTGCAAGLILALATVNAQAQWPFSSSSGEKPTLAPLLREVTPAVVSITVEARVQMTQSPLFNDPLFERFFGFQIPQQQPQPRTGAGSGVIIDADEGYVLTNHHVIDGADTVRVTLSDGRPFDARVIGSDEGTDIALLQIDAENLTALKLGNSDSLEVGDFVVAIGNPFGLGQTVTSGIVSALGRGGLNPDSYEDFIQTDASINPGNSGGALIDLDGQLVGINSAIIAPAGGNVGIGFAVPSNMASSVVRQLLEFGEVQRGQLGVTATDLPPGLSEGLDVDTESGAVVREVMAGSPAEEAGIEPGDIIVEMNGEPIDGIADLRNKVALLRVGSPARIVLIREGRRQTVNATIGSGSAVLSADGGLRIERLSGAEFRTLARGDELFGRVQGVVVTSVEDGSFAARNGLEPGDVITGVNRRAVRTAEEMAELVRQTRGAFALNVVRDNRRLFFVIQ